MAAVTGTINSCAILGTPGGPTYDSSGNQVFTAVIGVSFAGTYDTSADGTIANVDTTIKSTMRNGKTVTPIGACMCWAGLEGTTPVGALLAGVSYSGGTLTVQLTDGTLAAEHSNGALGTFNRDIGLLVTFKIS